jgi:predicted nuclease of restriction endonuclease-like (RecB) superfamily
MTKPVRPSPRGPRPQIERGRTTLAKLPDGYAELLAQIKERVRRTQTRAVLAANRELLRLYWQVGRDIVRRQEVEGWGSAVIERLARDLRQAFPTVRGLSPSNVWRMRAFYRAWTSDANLAQLVRESDDADLPQAVADLPWGHHVLLLERLKDPSQRAWYAQQAAEHGWSRAILGLQVEKRLHARQGKAVTNFASTLPPPQSDLAQATLKDPYVFDFLTIGDDARERELELGLLAHIEKFLLELGVGFALVGRQVPLEVGGEDYSVDLLFYHLRLRAYVVVELKVVPFKPEFAGKMNFYLSAVDDRLRHADDRPSIGLLLCRAKDRLVVEYALRDLHKPIGVAEWETRLVESLPADLKGNLPTVEELEAELTAPAGRRRR